MIGSVHGELSKLGIQNTLQLGFVVEDLSQAVKRHVDVLGIGPWQIYTITPPELKHTTIRGMPESYGLKLAITQVGNVQWELIQPLEGPSIYREFLKSKPGGGLHHFLVQVEDYEATLRELENRGIKILMSGTWRGATFAYADTEKSLGTIVEFFKVEPGWVMSAPEATYPSKVDSGPPMALRVNRSGTSGTWGGLLPRFVFQVDRSVISSAATRYACSDWRRAAEPQLRARR